MTHFVFLNAGADPGLSPQAAKRMRAHITRTNFAKRRERLHSAAVEKRSPSGKSVTTATTEETRPGLVLCRSIPLAGGGPVTQAHDPFRYAQILSSTWSHIFMGDQSYPESPDEAAWIDLLASEPALVESSMAVGLRHWSPDTACQREAGLHWSRAANAIIERISAGKADTAAVVASIATMAFGERLAGDLAAWEVHIDGFARLLEQRLVRGYVTLPPWIYELLILDAFNDVLGFPRFYHEKVIRQVRRYGHHPLLDIVALCSEFSCLNESLHSAEEITSEDMKHCDSLLRKTQLLQKHANSSVRATSYGLELALRITLRRHRTEPDLTSMTAHMRDALDLFIVRPCLYMDMTSMHFMVGALAAGNNTPERKWYVGKLRQAAMGLKDRGWQTPLTILEPVLASDGHMALSLRALWHEVCSSLPSPEWNVPKT